MINAKKPLTAFLTIVRKDIQKQIVNRGFVATGFAKNSMRVVANQFLKAEIRGVKYIGYSEKGNKAKNVKQPPTQAIMDWMMIKGIQPMKDGAPVPMTETNIKRSAFGIAKGLKERGNRVQQGRRNGLEFDAVIAKNMTPLLEEIGQEFTKSFKDNLKIKRK